LEQDQPLNNTLHLPQEIFPNYGTEIIGMTEQQYGELSTIEELPEEEATQILISRL
jgi:hypothetical protein